MFRQIKERCIMCTRTIWRKIITVGGQVYAKQLEQHLDPLKYSMIDFIGNYSFPSCKEIHSLVAVCMQTKLVVGVSGRSPDEFLRALNVLFLEQRKP